MKKEVLTLKKESAPANTNEASINMVMADKDFMKALGITPEDVIKQVKISEKEFKEISDYVANYKGTFAELYKELKGWNLGYANPEQDENNLFDCYYKSLLITVWTDEGVLKVSPNNVYVYPNNITKVDSDELFHLDFDKPIDYSKINTKVTESKKSVGRKILKKESIQSIADWVTKAKKIMSDIKANKVDYNFYEITSDLEEEIERTDDRNEKEILIGLLHRLNNAYSKIADKDNVREDKELLVEDLDEAFYEKICRAYIDTVNLEWVTTNPENNNSVVHGYFADDSTSAKWDYGAKVTPENFKEVAYDGYTQEELDNQVSKLVDDVEWYEYDTWEDFYEDYVKDEIKYDINDIGVYSDGSTDYDEGINHWDFYISEEDLTKLGLWNEDMKSEFIGESKKVTESNEEDLYDELVTALTDYEGYGDPDYADDIDYVIDALDNIKANWNLIVKTNKHNKEIENLYKTLSNALKNKNEKDLYHTGVLIQDNWEDVITADLDESKKVTEAELEDYDGIYDLTLEQVAEIPEVVTIVKSMYEKTDELYDLYNSLPNNIQESINDEFGGDSSPAYCIRWLESALNQIIEIANKK